MKQAVAELSPSSGSYRLSRRTAFWIVFIVLAALVIILLAPPTQRKRDARRAAEILRPVIASEARFERVKVSLTTNGRVILLGEVDSEIALLALRKAISAHTLPSEPVVLVQVKKI